ncbi:assimilatory sulfite reductase (NADPH) flavoprotein subunit [Glaesserella sp.]|uniref:assimilatory sulfite reductase (NADPH) flavoprotein subunit n=1 Tax=Glaesserella sp. TaxID=2094731 RepID=UPI0035A13371
MSSEKARDFPFSVETAQWLENLDNLQLAWLSGYCWAKAKGENGFAKNPLETTACNSEVKPLSVTVLSISQTGNAKGVAARLAERLNAEGIQTKLVSAKDYKAKNISDEQTLILVTSTQGEGEPPEEGVVLFKLLHGKKAPKLDNLEFAVFGLGDTSYPNFCQAGKDFDKRLGELGAKRLLERGDADLDFESVAEQWSTQIVELLKAKAATAVGVTATQKRSTETAQAASPYNKQNPFSATLLTNQKITARQAEKDVRHIELDLSGSGLQYQVGDALGVWFENDPALVEEILQAVGLSGDENIELSGQTLTLKQALVSHFELTQNTPVFVKGYAQVTHHEALNLLVQDTQNLQNFVQNTPLVDVLNAYPSQLDAKTFAGLLRPLTPRLYSISSAADEVGEEVHLSVGVVRFEHNGKARTGAASGFLADRVEEDGTVRVFVERNDNFRLPSDNSKPIVMIGSGTGIAPFRAFVQQRAAEDAPGKNWLIFGNQRFTQDFLYQTEWQQFAKDGFLHKYDFAWSRDQEEKVYVQHKIRQQAETLWQWLQDGAYLYVCGDAGRMAKDVENALLDVIEQQGKLTRDEAEEYLDELRENRRYQRDVY